MNIRQLNDANTMIKRLGIAVAVDSDKLLRTFAARYDTALESRKFCVLGYPEKLENRQILSFHDNCDQRNSP